MACQTLGLAVLFLLSSTVNCVPSSAHGERSENMGNGQNETMKGTETLSNPKFRNSGKLQESSTFTQDDGNSFEKATMKERQPRQNTMFSVFDCIPTWNVSTYKYDVQLQWTVVIDIQNAISGFNFRAFKRLNGANKGPPSNFFIPAEEGQLSYSHTDTVTPLITNDQGYTYNYRIITVWETSGPSTTGDCEITSNLLVPPPPTPVLNFSILSCTYEVNDQQFDKYEMDIHDLYLSWNIPTEPNAQLANLHFQVWIGLDPNSSDFQDVHNITNVSSSVGEGNFLTGAVADIIYLSNVTKTAHGIVYIQMRSYYQAEVGYYDNSSLSNEEFQSVWSDLKMVTLNDSCAANESQLPDITSSDISSGYSSDYLFSTENIFIITQSNLMSHSSNLLLLASKTYDVDITYSTHTLFLATGSSFVTIKLTSTLQLSAETIATSTSLSFSFSATNVNGVSSNLPFGGVVLVTSVVVLSVIACLCLAVCLCGLFYCTVRKNRKQFRALSHDLDNSGDLEMSFTFRQSANTTIKSTSTDQVFDGLRLDEWEVPANCVIIDEKLGEGEFGEVYRGIVSGDFNSPRLNAHLWNKDKPYVAVKLLKIDATGSERKDFIKEVELMKKIAEGNNAHVVNMLGAVTIQEPLCIITEFAEYGDLLKYLRASRKQVMKVLISDSEEQPYKNLGELAAVDLVAFAYEIASGMEYLSSLKVVHRDLACRNILIGEGKSLRITDFGMSRMVPVDSVYVKTTKGRLPLKWMSIESIIDREFTSASDVWSFGIVLWEIATLGGFPYPTISNEDLLRLLKAGYRMDKPDNCSEEVYQAMLACWQEDPLSRPSFIQLRAEFDSMLAKQRNASELYIELQTAAELQPCHDVEITKLEEVTYGQNNFQKFFPKRYSEDSSNQYVDSPKRDTDSVRQSLQLMLDDPTLPDVQILSLPARVAHNLEDALPVLPDSFSFPSALKLEEITNNFPTSNNN